MKPEQYKALKAIAYQSFESPQAGLHTLVKSDENFVRFVERRSRLKYYEQGGDFFMTANEKYFHLIGFIDALLYFYCSNYLKDVEEVKESITKYFQSIGPLDDEDRSDLQTALEEAETEFGILNHCIISYKCGED